MEETDPRMSGMFELDAPPPPPPPPQPVGVYGWRKRCLYTSVLVLMISVVLNLALTVWILRVLDFSWDGMGKLKLNPNGFTLKGEAEFLKSVYVDRIQNKKKPLYIHSNKQVHLSSLKQNRTERSQLLIDKNNIEAACDVFHVKDLNNNTQMMLNGSQVTLGYSDMNVPGPLKIKGSIKVPSIFGHMEKPLNITAMTSKVLISGLGGVSMRSTVENISLQAGDDIKIMAKGMIKLESEDIVLAGLPRSKATRVSRVYQLCLCFNGALFIGNPDGNCMDSSDVCPKSKP